MVFFVNITFLDFQEILTFLTENQKISNLSLKRTHEILGHAYCYELNYNHFNSSNFSSGFQYFRGEKLLDKLGIDGFFFNKEDDEYILIQLKHHYYRCFSPNDFLDINNHYIDRQKEYGIKFNFLFNNSSEHLRLLTLANAEYACMKYPIVDVDYNFVQKPFLNKNLFEINTINLHKPNLQLIRNSLLLPEDLENDLQCSRLYEKLYFKNKIRSSSLKFLL